MPLIEAASVSDSIIPIFDGENYEFWKVKMTTLLRSEGLWSIVQHGLTDPADHDEKAQAQEEKSELNLVIDAKALTKIQNGVSANIFPTICRATTAKQAWEILEKQYQGDGKTKTIKLQVLQRKFHNLTMKESECIRDYSSRVFEIVNQIRTLGEEMEDQIVVEKLLTSLSEKYDSIVAAIEESKDSSTLSIEQVVGSLKSHEQRRLRRISNAGKSWRWRLCRQI